VFYSVFLTFVICLLVFASPCCQSHNYGVDGKRKIDPKITMMAYETGLGSSCLTSVSSFFMLLLYVVVALSVDDRVREGFVIVMMVGSGGH
jgi:hypothetical protein